MKNPFKLLKKAAGTVFEAISLSPHSEWWADSNAEIVMCNRNFLKYTGLSNIDNVLDGCPYYDIPAEAGDMPEVWIEQDNMTMQSQKEMQFISYIKPVRSDERFLFYNVKNPVLNEVGESIGTINHSFEVSNNNSMGWLPVLAMNHDLRFFGEEKQAFTYILVDQYKSKRGKFRLTSRQSECLFLLLRGMTSREIAAILGRSERTVNDHIDHAKALFGCDTRSQLIEVALEEGFLNMIPKGGLPRILKLLS